METYICWWNTFLQVLGSPPSKPPRAAEAAAGVPITLSLFPLPPTLPILLMLIHTPPYFSDCFFLSVLMFKLLMVPLSSTSQDLSVTRSQLPLQAPPVCSSEAS